MLTSRKSRLVRSFIQIPLAHQYPWPFWCSLAGQSSANQEGQRCFFAPRQAFPFSWAVWIANNIWILQHHQTNLHIHQLSNIIRYWLKVVSPFKHCWCLILIRSLGIWDMIRETYFSGLVEQPLKIVCLHKMTRELVTGCTATRQKNQKKMFPNFGLRLLLFKRAVHWRLFQRGNPNWHSTDSLEVFVEMELVRVGHLIWKEMVGTFRLENARLRQAIQNHQKRPGSQQKNLWHREVPRSFYRTCGWNSVSRIFFSVGLQAVSF